MCLQKHFCVLLTKLNYISLWFAQIMESFNEFLACLCECFTSWKQDILLLLPGEKACPYISERPLTPLGGPSDSKNGSLGLLWKKAPIFPRCKIRICSPFPASPTRSKKPPAVHDRSDAPKSFEKIFCHGVAVCRGLVPFKLNVVPHWTFFCRDCKF